MKIFLYSTLFIIMAGHVQAQDKPFEQPYLEQDTLYDLTPTHDGQEGFHLWVWKPSFESNMPIKGYSFKDNKMNRDPLRKDPDVLPKLEEIIPEYEMPNPMKKDPENGSK